MRIDGKDPRGRREWAIGNKQLAIVPSERCFLPIAFCLFAHCILVTGSKEEKSKVPLRQ
jgi:hypothetical protein